MIVIRNMIIIAGVTLLAATCCSYGDMTTEPPPPAAGAHHTSVADVFGLLSSTGHSASDRNGDGFLDVSGPYQVNPAGYVLMHPSSWRLNARWVLYSFPAPMMGSGGGGGGGGGSGGGFWPMFGFDFGDGYWFPFYDLDDSDWDSYFGQSENPDSDGLFGVDENPVPEPTVLALLAAGIIAPLGRRRI